MVYLVGAGPGHPGLITCKGLSLLKECDAVIYDRLGTSELLEYVRDDCEKIYVGKKAGHHYKKQNEINEILIAAAKKYEKVVRLKGGDPFVFGRGGEEITALKNEKIPFLVVPGITSAISVPELVGVPVTHRESSRSFHVFTGHTKGEAANSLNHIHREEGTSVFLMGLSHLGDIVKRLVGEGENSDTPVAVISSGTMPSQQVVKGTLDNIVQRVKESGIASPAIIVVGATAEYNFISDDIGSFAGKKVGIVGTKILREKMRLKLEEKGASVYSVLDMKVVPTACMQELEEELNKVEKYSWIVFTSQNSISLFFDRMKKCDIDYRKLSDVKFAVVGSGTRNMLKRIGFKADYMPEHYTTKSLAEGLAEIVGDGEKVLIPRAEKSSKEMVEIIDSKGIDSTFIPIYDVKGFRTENWDYLDDFDIITFASASGVEAFVNELGSDMAQSWENGRKDKHITIGAIGQITAEALEKYGIHADCVPVQCDIEHLIDELSKYCLIN